jgi:hypothetical protein
MKALKIPHFLLYVCALGIQCIDFDAVIDKHEMNCLCITLFRINIFETYITLLRIYRNYTAYTHKVAYT